MDFLKHAIPEPNTGCWLWLGHLNKDGYGRGSHKGAKWLAHRFSYETAVGPIGDGLEIDHLCRVRCCVNPDHLEPVTPIENTRRSIRARIREGTYPDKIDDQHCVHGHDLNAVGQYRRKNRSSPACMECARIYRRRYDRARRAAA